MERGRDDLDPCPCSPRVCRDRSSLRSAVKFRVCSGPGRRISPPCVDKSSDRSRIVVTTDGLSSVQTDAKQAPRAKRNLDQNYSYLAGNAFGRDKKGRVKKDDPSEMHAAGEAAGAEYTPFVYYEFEVD
jgi:hypothetical protein